MFSVQHGHYVTLSLVHLERTVLKGKNLCLRTSQTYQSRSKIVNRRSWIIHCSTETKHHFILRKRAFSLVIFKGSEHQLDFLSQAQQNNTGTDDGGT